MCTVIPSRGRRLTSGEAALAIAQWRARLAIAHVVRHEPVCRFQVTGPDGRPGAALVGVVVQPEAGVATIYHTRRLTVEDIVHELLHVAQPDWSEQRVVSETWRLLHVPATTAGAVASQGRAPSPRRERPLLATHTARMDRGANVAGAIHYRH